MELLIGRLPIEAEDLLRKFILAFLKKIQFAGHLAERMSQDIGTDFFEWVDYITITFDDLPEFQNVGFVPDHVESESDVYYHPKAILPRVLVRKEGSKEGIPMVLAIRPESIVDFAVRHNLGMEIQGDFGSRFRQILVSEQDGHRFLAVERLAYRGYAVQPIEPGFVETLIHIKELWRTRKRFFPMKLKR